MENKAIDIKPKAATEMQSWTNIYDRVPSQYKQYVSYPTTAMNECPSKSEIRDKFPESTTSSNELADYSSITLNFSERQELSADSLAENQIKLNYIMEPTNELITKAEANAEGFSIESTNECMTKAEFIANLPTPPHFSYDFPLGNKRSIVIINGSVASKTIQINDDTIVLNPKDVWTKSYYDTTPIDVITQTNLEFRMIHSEGDSKNNNSQWIFPDEHLNAQAGNYLLTASQTHKLYLVSVFYITQ